MSCPFLEMSLTYLTFLTLKCLLLENGNSLPTGNEKFLYGYKITSDDLQYKDNSTGEFIKLWFDMDSPEDCQYDCEER